MVPFLPLYTENVKLPPLYFFILSIWFESLVLNQFQWRWLLISTSQHSHQSLLLFSSPNPITLLSLNHHTSPLLNSTVTLFCPFLPARTKNLLLWISALRLYMLNLLPPLILESPCFLLITFWSLVPPKVSFFWSLWVMTVFFFFLNGFFCGSALLIWSCSLSFDLGFLNFFLGFIYFGCFVGNLCVICLLSFWGLTIWCKCYISRVVLCCVSALIWDLFWLRRGWTKRIKRDV